MSSEAQRTAERINSNLPVHLIASDVEQNPEFLKLLNVLCQHITKDGTTITVQRDLDEAQCELRQEKSRWVEQHILYNELQELLLDHQIKNVQHMSSSNSQFYKVVGEMLTMTEIGDYFVCHPDPSSDVTLLGLNKEELKRRNQHNRHVQSIQQKIIPEIESRLREKCETLVSFHDCCANVDPNKTESSNLAFAKASQLPSILEAEQQNLEEEKRLLHQDKASRDKQLNKYIEALMQSLDILETLISKHRLRSQSQNDAISSEWLTTRCDAMCLKVKTLELQLLCDTYYSDTIQALSKIRHHLDKAVTDTEIELHKAGEALKVYEAVGMGFEALVEEFTQLRLEVDNKKWAIHKIKQHDGDDTFS